MAEIRADEVDGAVTVTGTGDLDLWVVKEFRKALDRGARSPGQLTVDFCKTDYIDSAILQALIDVHLLLGKEHRTVRILVKEESQPEYTLKVVGFDETMDVRVKSAS